MKIRPSRSLLILLTLVGSLAQAKEVCEMNKNESKIASFKLQTIQALQDLSKSEGDQCKALRDYLPTLLASVAPAIEDKSIGRLQQEEIDYRDSARRAAAGLAIINPNYTVCTGTPDPETCIAERYVVRQREIKFDTQGKEITDVERANRSADIIGSSLETAIQKSQNKDCPDDSPVLQAFIGAAFNISRDAGQFFPGGQVAGIGITTSLAALSKLIKSIFSRPKLKDRFLAKFATPTGDDVVCLINSINQKLLKCGIEEVKVPDKNKAGIEAPDSMLRAQYERSGIPIAIRSLATSISVPGEKASEKVPLHNYLKTVADDFSNYEKIRDEKGKRLLASDAGGLKDLLDLGSNLKQSTVVGENQKKIDALKTRLSVLNKELEKTKAEISALDPTQLTLDIEETQKEIEIWEKQGHDPEKTNEALKPLRAKLRALKLSQSKIARTAEIANEIKALGPQIAAIEKGPTPTLIQNDSQSIRSLLSAFDGVNSARSSNDPEKLRTGLAAFDSALKNFNAQFSPVGSSAHLLQSRDQEAAFALNAMAQRHAEIMKDTEQSDGKRFSAWKRMDTLYRDNQALVDQLKARSDELRELRTMERDLGELSNALVGTYTDTIRQKLRATLKQSKENKIFPRDAFLYCTLAASTMLFDERVITTGDDAKLAHKWVKVSPEWQESCVPLLSCYVEDLYKNSKIYRWPPDVPEEVKGAFFFKKRHARSPSAVGQDEVVKQVHNYICKLSIDSDQLIKKAEDEFFSKGTICGKPMAEMSDKGHLFENRSTAPREHSTSK